MRDAATTLLLLLSTFAVVSSRYADNVSNQDKTENRRALSNTLSLLADFTRTLH